MNDGTYYFTIVGLIIISFLRLFVFPSNWPRPFICWLVGHFPPKIGDYQELKGDVLHFKCGMCGKKAEY